MFIVQKFSSFSTLQCVFLICQLTVKSYPYYVTNNFSQYLTSNHEDNFIDALINRQQFSRSSLLILHDGTNSYRSSITSLISNNLDKSTILIQFNNISKNSFPVQFPPRISTFNKYLSPHKIVVVIAHNLNSDFMGQAYKLITPVYIPITRKDEDIYIFKSSPILHKNLLLMLELPAKIKYKIAVGTDSLGNVVVSTICFFCNMQGNPRLLKFPVHNNLPLENYNYFPDFVVDLNGKVLRVSVPLIRSKIEVNPFQHGVRNAQRGNCKNLFEDYLMVKFNFTYKMFISTGPDGNPGGGGTGVKLPNGTWIGIVGDIKYGRAELGIVIANAPDRMHHIDFTNSFFDTGCLTFVTRQATQIFSPAALLWPYDYDVWISICFGVILTLLVFIKLDNISSQFTNTFKSRQDYFKFLISTLIDQYCSSMPVSHGLRLLTIFWIFFAILISNIYRSQLLTLLVFPVFSTIPSTFQNVALSNYQIGFMKHGDVAYNSLGQSQDPVYKTLVNKMEIFTDLGLTCVHKCLAGRYACIGYDFALVHLKERNLTDAQTRQLTFAPATTYNIWLGIATEGKSIYRINFGKALSPTREFHLAHIWEKMDMYDNVRKRKLKWWEETKQNVSDEVASLNLREKDIKREVVTLKMVHVMGAFYVFGLFVGLSMAVFGYEVATVERTFVK